MTDKRKMFLTHLATTAAIGLVFVTIIVLGNGCASLLSLEASKREVVNDRVCAMRNPAIRGVALNDGAGIGIDIGNWQAVTNHPWRQLGAAALDAITAYAVYVGGKELMAPSRSASPASVNVTVSGQNNVTVNVNP